MHEGNEVVVGPWSEDWKRLAPQVLIPVAEPKVEAAEKRVGKVMIKGYTF